MDTGYLPDENKITQYYPWIIAATSIAAVGISIFCISNNIDFIYQHLYYIPIIIATLRYPKRGFYLSLLLAIIFLFITFVLTNANPLILSENLIRTIVFVGIAAIAAVISETLREDSLKYQRLFDNSGAATAVIDKSDRIIYCNSDFENISGYSLKELKRKKWMELIDENDLTGLFSDSAPETLKEQSLLRNMELKVIGRNGRTCYAIASINRIKELGITLLSLIDISAKIEAENILKVNEERYKKLFQHSADAIFIHSIKGRIFDANEQACKMTGYTLDMLRQLPLIKLYTESETDSAALNVSLLKKSGHCEFESRFVQSDGNIIDVDIRSFIIDSNTMVAQTIIRDITLRKRNEYALSIASKKLSILSSITRHDILNHIMVALANMEFAIMDSKEDKIIKFIEKAEKSVQTIQKQIEFSRDYQDMGGKPPKWQEIEALIAKCAANQNIPEYVNIAKEISGVEIYADPMLEKVFCNLIGNSMMHGGDVNEIRISFAEREECYKIIYEDNGKGIPDEKKELIFKAGYGSNHGFGLYLVKEILSITGIAITETGIPGKGAKFELIIHKNDFKITE